MTKKHVVISALHYPLTMARWFWNAFENRDDVVLHTIGPFSGTWIPWNGGMHLDQRYVKTPTIPLPISSASQKVPAALVNNMLDRDVDLWLDIDAGWHIEGRPDKAKCYVQIQTDPHVLKDHYKRVRSKYDKVFCMQNCYREEGEIYLPYAYDSAVHYPEFIACIEDIYHVCMIGLAYPQRMEICKRLINDGLTVKFGIGIVYNEYRHEYNKSKVAVSWSSLKDTPARVWEAMAMHVPLVCNRTPDLDLFFTEGKHYLGFDAVDEGVRAVKTLLDNPESAKSLADNAYELVKDTHTWDKRIEFIMKECGLL